MFRVESLGRSGAERLGWLSLMPPAALLGVQLGWWIVYRGRLDELNTAFANAPLASVAVVVAGLMCPTVASACGGLLIARRQSVGWLLFVAGIAITFLLVAAVPA